MPQRVKTYLLTARKAGKLLYRSQARSYGPSPAQDRIRAQLPAPCTVLVSRTRSGELYSSRRGSGSSKAARCQGQQR